LTVFALGAEARGAANTAWTAMMAIRAMNLKRDEDETMMKMLKRFVILQMDG